ncbi:MAG TPA: LCCL domain-containing protein [Thermotogota bacterium]|nr:LCCL domain-containing protein [Thermotogota bacterium]
MKEIQILINKIILFVFLCAVGSLAFCSSTLGDPGNLTGFRGQNGLIFEFLVVGSARGSLWGTEVYTDDSVLAAAAVHAGALKPGEEGVVTVEILEGRTGYDGSIQYGVVSRSYGAYSGSYRIIGFKAEVIPTLPDPGNMTGFRGQNGDVFKFLVQGTDSGEFWGTDIYTDDSRLSLAAVHSGALQIGEYGIVEVTVLPGQDNYVGSIRNGVTSSNYGAWHGSYSLKRVSEEPPVGIGEDPGDLTSYRDRTGEVLRFFVTGSDLGSVWGTGVYTDDSTLAVVCVHAGLLGIGETGLIEITLLPGLEGYEGSMQNGITSQSYGSWEWSYSVTRIQ